MQTHAQPSLSRQNYVQHYRDCMCTCASSKLYDGGSKICGLTQRSHWYDQMTIMYITCDLLDDILWNFKHMFSCLYAVIKIQRNCDITWKMYKLIFKQFRFNSYRYKEGVTFHFKLISIIFYSKKVEFKGSWNFIFDNEHSGHPTATTKETIETIHSVILNV